MEGLILGQGPRPVSLDLKSSKLSKSEFLNEQLGWLYSVVSGLAKRPPPLLFCFENESVCQNKGWMPTEIIKKCWSVGKTQSFKHTGLKSILKHFFLTIPIETTYEMESFQVNSGFVVLYLQHRPPQFKFVHLTACPSISTLLGHLYLFPFNFMRSSNESFILLNTEV